MSDYLSPWDAIGFFQTPTITRVDNPGAAARQVCVANPQRVYLVITVATPGGTVWVSPQVPTAANNGLIVNASGPPLAFNLRDSGPCPSLEWNFWAAGAVSITVLEVIMIQWPQRSRTRAAISRPLPAEPNGRQRDDRWRPDSRP